MNPRHAWLIRCGIIAARKPDTFANLHLAPGLVQETHKRETQAIKRALFFGHRRYLA